MIIMVYKVYAKIIHLTLKWNGQNVELYARLKTDRNIIFLFHKIILVQLNATDDLIAPTCDLIWMLIISDIGSSSRFSCATTIIQDIC